MTDIEIPLFGKDILIQVPDEVNLKDAFNEAVSFVEMLAANSKIRDLEIGINPPGATHEIVKEESGAYRLNRFRFA